MKERTAMRLLDIKSRKTTFSEVALGYNYQEALDEASRCLNCKAKPCVSNCPVGVDIPSFISLLKNGNIDASYQEITKANVLPQICGRVCPQEKQCEAKCVLNKMGNPIAIGRLERFVADNNKSKQTEQTIANGKKVAVIGSGPAGLTCAGILNKKGYEVTVYEAMHKLGGVLRYGIPEFRLPKEIVDKEINQLQTEGVNFETNVVCGKTITLDELKKENDYVFIGTGAGLPKFMDIPGEQYNGVLSANEFLTRINLMKAYDDNYLTPIKKAKNIAIVGGGNVAMDSARCAIRLGAEHVYLIYRRSKQEMPARNEEIEHALEEGVIFKELHNPLYINGQDGNVTSITCVKMRLEEDANGGRKIPVPTEEKVTIDVDMVVMAIGNFPNPLLPSSDELLTTDRKGCIIIDEDGKTSIEDIYAGGDAVSGAATVILAMEAGKRAAESIDNKNNK